MKITVRKLETGSERYTADWLIATSFLHEWDEKEAKKEAECPKGDVWGAFDEADHMVSAVTTLRHDMTYEGEVISCEELHMVGTLAESRGGGAIHALIGSILRECRERGDLFSTLIPFSFAFYRKYGFEAASEMLIQKTEIEQFASFPQELTAKQILSQEDVDEARELYRSFALRYNLADLGTEEDWTYRGSGEFGERDWMHQDKPHYSYLFRDQDGKARAYFTFVFVHGPEGPFTGTMAVTELIFDSPGSLRSVFGFFYGMRAKITDVSVELPADVDLSVMLPECDSVERKLKGYYTARVLNVEKVLSAMGHPDGEGTYSIRVTDQFLPENTGTYTVRFSGRKTTGVTAVCTAEAGEAADLEITAETFCQLAVGVIDLNAALYRSGTKLNANRSLLERVFVKRPVFLR